MFQAKQQGKKPGGKKVNEAEIISVIKCPKQL